MANGLIEGNRQVRSALWASFAAANRELAASALKIPGGPLGFKISKDCEKAAKDCEDFSKRYA